MKPDLMIESYQSAPWDGVLAAHTATALPAAKQPRWLEVLDGDVWLTGGPAGTLNQDIWLSAGQRHPLPKGTNWVLEGGPTARVKLLQAWPVAAGPSLRRAPAWWRKAGQLLSAGSVAPLRLEP